MLIGAIALLSMLGTVLMFAARTGPEEASSNLSKWTIWMGMRAPRWLTTPSANYWAKRISIMFFIGAAGILFTLVYGNAQNQPTVPSSSVGTVSGGVVNIYNYPIAQVVREKASDPKLSQNSPNLYAPGSIIAPQGGYNSITNTFGPQPRDLNSAWGQPLKAEILRELPRDKEIQVTALVGDGDAIRLAAQIYEFLKSSGFRVKETGFPNQFSLSQ